MRKISGHRLTIPASHGILIMHNILKNCDGKKSVLPAFQRACGRCEQAAGPPRILVPELPRPTPHMGSVSAAVWRRYPPGLVRGTEQ